MKITIIITFIWCIAVLLGTNNTCMSYFRHYVFGEKIIYLYSVYGDEWISTEKIYHNGTKAADLSNGWMLMERPVILYKDGTARDFIDRKLTWIYK